MHGDIKGTGSEKKGILKGEGGGVLCEMFISYMKGSDSKEEKSSLKTGMVLGEKRTGIEACRAQFLERERETETQRERQRE